MEIGLVQSKSSYWSILDHRHYRLLLALIGDHLLPRHCLSGLNLQASLLGYSDVASLKVFHFTKLTSLSFSLCLSLNLALSLSLNSLISLTLSFELRVSDWPNFTFINILSVYNFLNLALSVYLNRLCWCV